MKRIAKNPKISVENGIVKFDRVDALEIAQRFGTPCFIFLENNIRSNCRKLKQELLAFFPDINFFYSIKSNFLEQVCKTVHNEGYGAEVVSQLEYRYAKNLGFSPSEIEVGNPYLPDKFLRELISDCVR